MAQLLCFDELKELALRDPVGFESYRQSMCEAFIDSIPPANQPRLRAVQFRVNTVIHRAKTPMAGLIKVSGMMHDSLRTLSDHLIELSEHPYRAPQAALPAAEVVDLQRWKRRRRSH